MIILHVAGSKGMTVNIIALLTPILPLVEVPEHMLSFMGQWTYTACVNATVTVILTMLIHTAF